MGAPITKEFGAEKTCLKFFKYQGAACLVPASGVEADANGNKISQRRCYTVASDGTTCSQYRSAGNYEWTYDENGNMLQTDPQRLKKRKEVRAWN